MTFTHDDYDEVVRADHHSYSPNFDRECHICGHSPTVVVNGHVQPETHLCGRHFFGDKSMVDWSLWNEDRDDTD